MIDIDDVVLYVEITDDEGIVSNHKANVPVSLLVKDKFNDTNKRACSWGRAWVRKNIKDGNIKRQESYTTRTKLVSGDITISSMDDVNFKDITKLEQLWLGLYYGIGSETTYLPEGPNVKIIKKLNDDVYDRMIDLLVLSKDERRFTSKIKKEILSHIKENVTDKMNEVIENIEKAEVIK